MGVGFVLVWQVVHRTNIGCSFVEIEREKVYSLCHGRDNSVPPTTTSNTGPQEMGYTGCVFVCVTGWGSAFSTTGTTLLQNGVDGDTIHDTLSDTSQWVMWHPYKVNWSTNIFPTNTCMCLWHDHSLSHLWPNIQDPWVLLYVRTQNPFSNTNMNPNKGSEFVSFYLECHTNPNSQGCVLCMPKYTCVHIYDDVVVLVLHHLWWYSQYNTRNKEHKEGRYVFIIKRKSES